MTALSGPRLTPLRPDYESKQVMTPPVQNGVVIWSGGIVVLDGGFAMPGRSAPGLTVLGIAQSTVDNRTYPTNLYGRKRRVCVVGGVAQFENSRGEEAIGEADVGRPCYLVDDRTLARTDGAGKRSRAGTVREVERDRRVWVALGAHRSIEGP
jgi:hypothetical protein